MPHNVCNYIPYRNDYHSIHTVNFVYETKQQQYSRLSTLGLYRVYYVCSGKGNLHLPGKTVYLKQGDVFFTFPATAFCIESAENFTYMYISFLGSRANQILGKLHISQTNFHFADSSVLEKEWQKGLEVNAEISDLITESVLLYTFYYLGQRFIYTDAPQEKINLLALNIKKYVDDHCAQQNLTLETLGKELSYSPKYISSAFKKHFQIALSDYIATVRIQHACTLIQQGLSSVSDIANLCGYADAQYFSKIFKQKMGCVPTEHIRHMRAEEQKSDEKR